MIKLKQIIKSMLRLIISLLIVFFYLGPLYSALIGSLTPYGSLGEQMLYPKYFYYENYKMLFTSYNFGAFVINSILYAFFITIIILFISFPAAYAVSRFNFRGRSLYLFCLLATQMVPFIVILIPIYMVVVRMGFNDTYASVIIVTATIGLPFPIWMLQNYFNAIPKELDAAAKIDGCNHFEILWRIILPISSPGIVAVLALTISLTWGQFVVPYILLSDDIRIPITVAIFRLLQQHESPWHIIMAGSIISAIPPLFLYLMFQKYVIGGLTAGSVKT